MTVYFLRHGETAWNCESRIQGQTPHTDLTDFGVRLAEATRAGFAARGIRFDRAFTSPLRRAVHTAEIVLRGQECPCAPDARLREIGFGPYEGTRMGAGLWADDNIHAFFKDPERYRPPAGAESLADVETRVADFLANALAPLEGLCENVLAVTHGGFLRAILHRLLGTPLADYWKGRQPNCCAHIVSVEKGVFSVVAQSAVFYDAALAAAARSV